MATQEERKAETRRLLLDAAADLFARKGIHAVSVDTVADAAGRTSGAVYAHFGGKDGLLLALAERLSGRASAGITAELAAAGSVDERLAAVWAGYGAAGERDADAPWSLLEHELWLEANRRPEVAEAVAARFAVGRQRTGEGMAAWADEAGRTGDEVAADRSPVTPDQLGTLVLGLLYGLEMQRRLDPAAVPDDLAVTGLRLLLGLDVEPAG